MVPGTGFNAGPAWARHDPTVLPRSAVGGTERRELLDAEDRLRLGPVLLELVEVALRRREDVDDRPAEVEQHPVRGGGPSRPIGRIPSVRSPDTMPSAMASSCRSEPPEQMTNASASVVSSADVEQDDVGRLLILGQLDYAAGQRERFLIGLRGAAEQPDVEAIGARGGFGLGRAWPPSWASRPARAWPWGLGLGLVRGHGRGRLSWAIRPLGGGRRLGPSASASPRPSPSGPPASAQREWAASPEARVRSRSMIPPGGSVEPHGRQDRRRPHPGTR